MALITTVREISLISNLQMADISEIKLIRTDTTLDLSQKAEKVYRSVSIQTTYNVVYTWTSTLEKTQGDSIYIYIHDRNTYLCELESK